MTPSYRLVFRAKRTRFPPVVKSTNVKTKSMVNLYLFFFYYHYAKGLCRGTCTPWLSQRDSYTFGDRKRKTPESSAICNNGVSPHSTTSPLKIFSKISFSHWTKVNSSRRRYLHFDTSSADDGYNLKKKIKNSPVSRTRLMAVHKTGSRQIPISRNK